MRSSPLCGCFYCLGVFAPDEIERWIDDGSTALCPRCGVDAVIGELSGYPIRHAAFLQAMHELWF